MNKEEYYKFKLWLNDQLTIQDPDVYVTLTAMSDLIVYICMEGKIDKAQCMRNMEKMWDSVESSNNITKIWGSK